jgi:cell division protein FtsB
VSPRRAGAALKDRSAALLSAAGRLNPRRLGIAAMVVLAVGLAVFGVKESVRAWQIRREMAKVQRELTTLRARQSELTKAVERLRSDPHYIEKLAREEMGMVREGETVLKFPSPASPTPR